MLVALAGSGWYLLGLAARAGQAGWPTRLAGLARLDGLARMDPYKLPLLDSRFAALLAGCSAGLAGLDGLAWLSGLAGWLAWLEGLAFGWLAG